MKEAHTFVDLGTALQRATTLEEMLQRLADHTASVLSVKQTSVRLLDAAGERLLVGARTGEPVHAGDAAALEFAPGEGLVGWVVQHAKMARVDRVTQDARWIDRPGIDVPIESFIAVPLIDGMSCIGVLSAVDPRPARFGTREEELLALTAAICTPYLQIARWRRIARIDPVTFALNDAGLEEEFPALGTSMSAGGLARGVSAVVVAIDGFGEIVDRYGLAVGDRMLSSIASIVRGVLRRGDTLVRQSPHQFLVLVPGAALTEAARIAERARRAGEGHLLTLDASDAPSSSSQTGRSLHVTLSIGVSERGAGVERDVLIRRAADAMSVAQHRGGNRVEIAR